MSTLIFQSPDISLRSLEPARAHSAVLDDWKLSEIFGGERVLFRGVAYEKYRVSMTYECDAEEDPGSAYIHGITIADAVERSWLYATGTTIAGRGYDYFLRPLDAPVGWRSNGEEVTLAENWALLSQGVSYANLFRTVPQLPLQSCLSVLENLSKADGITLRLIAYHFGAVTSRDHELPFLLLAQGMEVTSALLEGDTKKKKAASIPTLVKSRMNRGFDWLLAISNQREQTRHAVDKRESVTLKPPLDDQEEIDFAHDANIMLQYMIALRLQVPLVYCEDGVSVTLL